MSCQLNPKIHHIKVIKSRVYCMILYPLRPNLVREKRSSSVIMTRNIIMISRHKKKKLSCWKSWCHSRCCCPKSCFSAKLWSSSEVKGLLIRVSISCNSCSLACKDRDRGHNSLYFFLIMLWLASLYREKKSLIKGLNLKNVD